MFFAVDRGPRGGPSGRPRGRRCLRSLFLEQDLTALHDSITQDGVNGFLCGLYRCLIDSIEMKSSCGLKCHFYSICCSGSLAPVFVV